MTETKNTLSRASRMEKLLQTRFDPVALTLVDESGRHAGHAGAHPDGETHFRVRIVSNAFAGLSRVARHRLVTEALSEEFAGGLHALSLELKTPQEDSA